MGKPQLAKGRAAHLRLALPVGRVLRGVHEGLLRPLSKAFEALDEEGQQSLQRDLIELVERYNRSGDETAVWPADYLEVVATKR